MCAGCDKQVTVKIDTMKGYRKSKYFCAECEPIPNCTSLALSGDATSDSHINLDILDADGTMNNTSTFTSGGGKYISTEELKYNKLKSLVKELQN